MSKFFKILIYLVMLATSAGYSQSVPWTVQPTTVSEEIAVNIRTSLFEGDTLLLGAFYSISSGTPKCGGYARIPGDSILKVYGKDAYFDGFMPGEQYQFRIYNPEKGCYMVLGQYNSYTFGSPAMIDSTLKAALAEVIYPETVSCRGRENLIPVISNNLTTMFYSTSGLAVDSITGVINTEKSIAGTYAVKAVTESCLVNETFSITITEGKKLFQTKDTTVCSDRFQLGTDQSAESYKWNTGDILQYIYVSESGEYSLEVADTNGCLSNDTIEVSIFNPGQKILGNDTTVCANSITLSVPEGYTYKWSTGATDKSAIIDSTGAYWVEVGNGVCSIRDSIHVKLIKPVQFDLGKDTTGLCSLPYQLKGPSGYSYSWSTGATSETINVSKTGLYSLDVSDDNGCQATDSIYLAFSWADIPAVNLGSDTIVCATSMILNANAGNSTVLYSWNTGESGSFIEVNASGKYYVKVQDKNGCSNSDSINVEFKDGFLAGNISIEINNPPCNEASVTIKTDSLNGTLPYTYDLIKNGIVVSNSVNGVFNKVPEGSYNFEIKDSKGCKALTSNGIITVRKAEPCPEKVLVFTGTSQPSYFIEFSGVTKIYDMAGNLIKNIPTPAEWDGTGNNGEIVPMGDYIIVCGENPKIVVTVIK